MSKTLSIHTTACLTVVGIICILTGLPGCTPSLPTNVQDLPNTTDIRTHLPDYFVAAVVLPKDRLAKKHNILNRFRNVVWSLDEGRMFGTASRNFIDYTFGKACKFSRTSKQSIIIRIDGKLEVDLDDKRYTTFVNMQIFTNSGLLIGEIQAKSDTESDVLNDELAIYNSYLRSLSTAAGFILSRRALGKSNATIGDLMARIKPPSTFNPSVKNYFSKMLKAKGAGTGFFVNKKGDVVTNASVVDNCLAVSARIDGSIYLARNVTVDKDKDLAVVKFNTRPKQYVVFAPSSPSNVFEEEVLTIGFPLKLNLKQSKSISPALTEVKFKSINDSSADRYLMQISARIKRGNSGGPLIDMYSRVVGAISHSLNFAVDAGAIKSFLEQNQIDFLSEPRQVSRIFSEDDETKEPDYFDSDEDDVQPASTFRKYTRSEIANDYGNAVVQVVCHGKF
jgi:S1-C subfamily serine protease